MYTRERLENFYTVDLKTLYEQIPIVLDSDYKTRQSKLYKGEILEAPWIKLLSAMSDSQLMELQKQIEEIYAEEGRELVRDR